MESFDVAANSTYIRDLPKLLDKIQNLDSGNDEQNRHVRKFQNKLRTTLRMVGNSEEAIFYCEIKCFVAATRL